MKNKIKISYIVGACALIISALSVLLFVKAENVGSQVNVGSTTPSFTVAPAESPASTSSAMWNEGTAYAITATAADTDADDYYLIVCGSSTAPTPADSAPPSCTNQLCVSSATASATQATCSITPTSSYSENQAWYAFVCDHTTGSACSAAAQGAGDSGSPIYVNFRPTFTTAPTKPSADPGAAATFTVPSTGWGDANTGATGKLLVCATAGISNGACTGDTLCSSVATSPGNDLTCNYTLPAVIAAGDNNAYVYVVDDNNLEATGAIQGSNVGYTVNNVAPVIQSVVINDGNDITLSPGGPTAVQGVPVYIYITDTNGCGDISSVSGVLGINIDTGNLPTSNSEQAYVLENCFVADDFGACSGPTDATVAYGCGAQMRSYSNPTDATGYATDNWEAYVQIEDAGSLTDDFLTTGSANVDVNSLVAISIPDSINYGSLWPGDTSGGGFINVASTIDNRGNTGLNAEISGLGQGLCINSYSATCPGAYIPLAQQKWEITNNTTSYASGLNVLSTTVAPAELKVLKRTELAPTQSKPIYWGILIPSGQTFGGYHGQTAINGVISPIADW